MGGNARDVQKHNRMFVVRTFFAELFFASLTFGEKGDESKASQ
jgi:hypothetical protein